MKQGTLKSLAIALCALVWLMANGSAHATGYQFDVPLAPYCLSGSFPLSVTTQSGTTTGALTLAVSSQGLLSGNLALGGGNFSIIGKYKSARGITQLSFSGSSGANRISFKGSLQGQSFVGTTKGSGTVVPGIGTFSLYVSGASSLVAHVGLELVDSGKGSLAGTGTVTSCGQRVAVTAKGKLNGTLKLSVKGKFFTWSGTGVTEPRGYAAAWRGKGFGSSSTGAGLTVTTQLDKTQQTVVASQGGTITLNTGTSISIPPNVLAADQTVTVADWSAQATQPPNPAVGSFGPAIATSLNLASPPSLALAGASSNSIEYVISLTNLTVSGFDGAVPAIVFTAGGTNYFLGVPGKVDTTNQVMIVDVPVSLLQSVASQFGSEAQHYSVIFVNTFGLQPATMATNRQEQAAAAPLAATSSFDGIFWNGSQWITGFDSFDPSKKTLVLVHGIFSTVPGAYGGCVEGIRTAGGYEQVVGFNYNWLLSIDHNGTRFAAFLDQLMSEGVTHIDIEAHSEGVPVALSAASKTSVSINHMILLGGPIMGTPVCNLSQDLITLIVNTAFPIEPISGVGIPTMSKIVDSTAIHDLQTASPELASIRAAFVNRSQQDTQLIVISGTTTFGWELVGSR